MPRSFALLFFYALAGVAPGQSPSPPLRVTPPFEHFGFNIGDDYKLANYQQISSYWKKLAAESDRVKVVSMGNTEEGRPQLMCIVTSPSNHKDLARYKEIARKMATAEATPEEARKLANEGKAVVWIDGGLHASEVLCAQAITETLYQLVTQTDPETMRFLDDAIVLIAHANPDGNDLCADWYMREKAQNRRSLAGLPRLYQKYIGHDNNRDFYANTQAESKNINRVLYREWFPQIVYNHHQTGPAGAVLFCPPFRDPFNYNFDPLVVSGIDAVGAAMMQRFLVENKPGATSRSGAPYSTWFNGGLRTTTYFHNMIGLLTETIGSPTPSAIPYIPAKQLPKADYLSPIAPQEWHFKQSVDYSVTANKAVIDYASRHKEQMLYNIWHMGRAAVERGKRDSWTITPKKIELAGAGSRGGGGRGGGGTRAEFERGLHKPADRDPRGFILPSDQPDFLTAVKFVNALLACGVTVHKATAEFTAAGKKYPAGSLVVLAAQPFRAHVVDMFEPQDYPNDFAYPGGPPIPPYDTTGYTLAFQMGPTFDRVLEEFGGPFEVVKDEALAPPPGRILYPKGAVGFVLDCRANDSFRAVNRLFKADEEVRRMKKPVAINREVYPAGSFFVANNNGTMARIEKIAAEVGTSFVGCPTVPGKEEASVVKSPRIALWDRYGGSMPSGWTRWVLERFEFPFTVVYPPELDKGNLRAKYDVILFPDGAVSRSGGRGGPVGDEPPAGAGPADNRGEDNLPPEYRGRRGNVTPAVTGPQLKKFLNEGGTILSFGSSTGIYDFFGLPLTNHLTTVGADGNDVPIGRDRFFVPGSVIRTTVVAPTNPLTYGLDKNVDVMFAGSPVYRLKPEATGVTVVAKYEGKTTLRSGWAWGQQYLDGGIAVAEAQVGKGTVVLFAPQVNFRGQTQGAFKLWFNGIVRASTGE